MPETDFQKDLLQAQVGNMEALGRVLAASEERLWAFLETLVPLEVCEDVLQETYLGICKGLRTLMSNRKFRSWSYQIAYHKAMDWYRRHRKERTTERLDESFEVAAEVEIHQKEDQEKIRKALNRLSPGLKETCWLFYVE